MGWIQGIKSAVGSVHIRTNRIELPLGDICIGFARRPTLGLCAIQALDHVGEKMRGGTNSPDCIPRAQMCLGANFPPQRQKIRATIYGHHPITERKLIADNAVLLGTRST